MPSASRGNKSGVSETRKGAKCALHWVAPLNGAVD